ncbi:DUF2254 domain-containing protein [Hymenobacter rubripertinctus]|uniref:DUF2254 domain-containing protein n=1 Tax=Hymenobacter rubripertinctus TaxID=2029981 RepID=A0A418QVQ2_9BACT|nr:DUF2254 domain-containing protein [Hymenobacter rubripertinctus]RIY09070.1 DUF2254 domain-containing protein [Hymenobacter rubripertinctus]
MNRLRQIWSNINSSLWFVPALMVVAAMLAAYFLVLLDVSVGNEWTQDYSLLFGAGADGARGMLTAIAGSMITVAGLIFSLTLATLATVSSQYTSRLLRNFMRDRANQVVMGFFVSIFVYCLIILRTIRGGDEGRFIPSLAVAFGLLLALVSIGVLIFFIHHIATSIQAANIIARIANETYESMEKLFPERLGEQAGAAATAHWQATQHTWAPIPARRSGYVQNINNEALLDFARETDSIVRMERGIGSFVARGAPLVSVARYNGEPLTGEPAEIRDRLNDTYSLGDQRTLDQDLGFGFRQLVDIALKALSPGINDTTTAVMCVDQLGALLSQLVGRQFDEPLRMDEGRVRVAAISTSFATYLTLALDQIRVSGAGNVAVLLRLLTAIETTARRVTDRADRALLHQHTELVREQANRTLETDYEKQRILERCLVLREMMEV